MLLKTIKFIFDNNGILFLRVVVKFRKTISTKSQLPTNELALFFALTTIISVC